MRSMSHLISVAVATPRSAAPLVARVGLAIVMFPHGAQKVLGWWGGHGWSGTYAGMTEQMGLPGLAVVGVMLLEFIGPLLLVMGAAVRPVSAAFAALMLGTIVTVHGEHGFFMNWFGQQEGEGIEYALLAVTLSASLVLSGGGRWSLDRLAAARMPNSGSRSLDATG